MSILIGSICFLVPIGSSSLSKGKATAEGDDGDDEDANPPKEQRIGISNQKAWVTDDIVMYKGQDGPEQCTIIKQHLDNLPEIYYTIRMSDGHEKQTLQDWLSPIAPRSTGWLFLLSTS